MNDCSYERTKEKNKQIKGEAFDWLYVDFHTLSLYASQYGFKAERVREGSHYDYLARLIL